MNNLIETLKNFTQKDYEDKKVDLHIHTAYSDGEGKWEQIIPAAKAKGYKLISITDHNTVKVHHQIQDEILLNGVEFDCWFNFVLIHLLAYGIDINHPDLQPFFAKDKNGTDHVLPRLFSFRNVPKLIKAIHSAGGVAILAHPACYWAINLEKFVKKLVDHGLDGIETYYPYPRFRKFAKFHSAESVIEIANKYPQLIKTGGSDFHGVKF